ncbi:MAG: ribonuclease HII [Oscillospiraceae bacterium]
MSQFNSLYEFDLEYTSKFKYLAGVDEAGRGPLAGPVTAACVILKDKFYNSELNDSKKISEKKREELYDVIVKNAIDYNIVCVDNFIVDDINILNATKLAMKEAIDGMRVMPQFALIDGNFIPQTNVNCEFILKGDAKSFSIAAASILAKVHRDRLMREYSDIYPCFNFKKHKGYPTKEHYEEITKYGYTNIHRLSYLKKMTGIFAYEK